MPTPNTDYNTDMEISTISMNAESNNDNVSNLILVNSSEVDVDTFTLPIDFDSSNSSMGTLESVDESLKEDASLPMLTDIAEETVYETEEFLEETLKMDEKPNMSDFSEEREIISCGSGDLQNVLIDTSVIDNRSNVCENAVKIEFNEEVHCKTEAKYVDGDENTFDSCYLPANNGICIASAATPSTSEVSNLITISNNTNLASGFLEIAQNNSAAESRVEVVSSNRSNVFTNIPNVIQMNPVNNSKISTYKPITIQSTSKFVPISIAPNTSKRPASISIGQPASNVITKVIVGQGKVGQPYVIANAPKQKPICVLPTSAATSSPVKSITVAQAKQMGIKLQPLRPSTTKPLKQKIVISNIPPGAQVLKKIQPVSKVATPTKILPAPLVSNSATAGQPTKIFVSQDYVMKGGTLVPKQPGGQVITISNLQLGPLVSNHVSPKKQVQYIKLSNNVGSTNMPTVATPKGKITTVSQNSTLGIIDKDTPIIVASAGIPASNLNLKGTNSVQTSKPTATSNITVLPVIPPTVKAIPGQRLILPAVSKSKMENTSQPLLTDASSLSASGSIVVVPDSVIEKLKGELLSNPVKLKEDSKNVDNSKISHDSQENVDIRNAAKSPTKQVASSFETGNGLRSRKPCNCTRSQCLKLYCECFANGEFCNNCNCVSCYNNISHEENRQHAIKSCLDRNPQAFRPKIGKCLVGLSDRRHTKGCHCKRSGCLKNYCECYEAQIPCSENCKCIGCKNIDEMLFATSYSSSCNNFEKSDSQMEFQTFSKNKLTAEINDAVGQSGATNPRHAFSFIKDQVVEATCQCLLAQADEVKRRNINNEDGQKYILEEFGRCLIQIIECAPDKYNPS